MSANPRRDVLVTGIGLVSSLGEGPEQHWAVLNAKGGPKPVVDRERFAPYPVHRMVALDFDRQIPKRGDQRQMEPWQRIGTYTAGLALEHAGISGDEALLARTDMIVAAGGGERDIGVDSAILREIVGRDEFGTVLNERLAGDLRPTLFLAQLPNLLAGNISIVHKVTGSSRTFMGEEAAGVDAVRTAHARIASGQSDICLVGGSYNAEREDMLLLFELGGYLWRDDFLPVWERAERGGGMITGSLGAFLVLESPEHAAARGRDPIARLDAVRSGRCGRKAGQATEVATHQFSQLRDRVAGHSTAVISGASGAEPASSEERAFLTGLAGGDIDVTVRAGGSLVGHGFEAQFPALVALASLAARHRRIFPALDTTGFEGPATDVDRIIVTSWGHWRGEGMGLVSPVE